MFKYVPFIISISIIIMAFLFTEIIWTKILRVEFKMDNKGRNLLRLSVILPQTLVLVGYLKVFIFTHCK